MSDDKKFFEILMQIGRTPEEQAKLSHSAIISIDRKLVHAVAERYGAEKALEVHKKKWAYIVKKGFENAKKELKIGEIKDLQTLGRIIKHIYDNTMLCPYKVAVDTPQKVIGLVVACPFFDMGRLVYGDEYGTLWFKALANTCIFIVKNVTDLAGLARNVRIDREKCMCLHESDKICQITLESSI